MEDNEDLSEATEVAVPRSLRIVAYVFMLEGMVFPNSA